jgi:1-phosphofructokinase family hexose kinase
MAILTIGFNPAIDRILECPDFHIGGHQQARQVARLAAGKAANVSRALAQLSTDSIATGFIGADELEFFHEQLMSAGPGRILCRFVEVSGKTRENISILDPKRRLETHLRDRGFTVAPEETSLLERKIMHELKPGDVAIFAGSLSNGVSSQFFANLIDLCGQHQTRVVVDSSGEPLRAASQKNVWLLKPNLDELRQLLGTEIPATPSAICAAASPLLNTVENLLISRGPQGAILLTRQATFNAHSTSKESPVRTVGCGDHLLAGFVSELAAGREVERALAIAMAVATARAFSPKMEEFDPNVMRAALESIVIEKL